MTKKRKKIPDAVTKEGSVKRAIGPAKPWYPMGWDSLEELRADLANRPPPDPNGKEEKTVAAQTKVFAAGELTIIGIHHNARAELAAMAVRQTATASASDLAALRELGQQRDAAIPVAKRARLAKAGYLENASRPYRLTERARRVLVGGSL